MYDDVLVPTDGSEQSAAAVDQAVAVADRFGASLRFLYVVDVGTEMSASAVGTVAEELTETMETMAEDALGEAVERAAAADVPAERATVEGLPHEAIAADAAEQGVDLVVLGASGHSGLAAHLLGSTTERVTEAVDVSVLVARP